MRLSPSTMAQPSPPYYAVIFTSLLRNHDGYDEMSRRMVENVSRMPGFLGFDSARGADGLGITVSYWQTLEAIRAWKEEASHRAAQARGREHWYSSYSLRISQVLEDRRYEFVAPPALLGDAP